MTNEAVAERPPLNDDKLSDDVLALIKRYGGPVPRFTSFPTAVQFTPAKDARLVESALHTITEKDRIAVYVHVPFCDRLCYYCGCHTKIVNHYRPVAEYCEELSREIVVTVRKMAGKPRLGGIHFGGGSPNFLKIADLAKIIDKFRQQFHFDEETHLNIECDPRLLDRDYIAGLAGLGLKLRLSLGVQDFQADVQVAINRVQPLADITNNVNDLREHGIHAINFDLMIGLPLQTMEGVADNLAKTLALSPSRIAVFAYAHVPWMKKHQGLIAELPRPDAATRYAMADMVKKTLVGAGYQAIGIDHFAKADDPLAIAARNRTMVRNFQGYSDDPCSVILGFGISAISQFADAYSQNAIEAPAYRQALAKNKLPVIRQLKLNESDLALRAAIMELMCYGTIKWCDHPAVEQPLAALENLAADGLVLVDEAGLTITERGFPFTRVVAAAFDPYQQTADNQPRHAAAI